MATCKYAIFSVSPKISHEWVVRRIERYLKGANYTDISVEPNNEKLMECYIDAAFTDGWDKTNSRYSKGL